VRFLAQKGANLHLRDNNGYSPIIMSYDHAETTRILLENGANPNDIGNLRTPLFFSGSNKYDETVKALLEYNPDLEISCATDTYPLGQTVLTMAAANDATESCRLLLEAGANVDRVSDFTALQYAVSRDNLDLVRVLLQYNPNKEAVNADGNTALNSVSNSTSLAVLKALVNAGADLETRNKIGETVLYKAVLYGKADLVEYLISKKVNLNTLGAKYGSPLTCAARYLNFEMVDKLVKAGADVNLADSSTAGTPIQSAGISWVNDERDELQDKVVRYLIEEGKADVSAVGGMFVPFPFPLRFGCRVLM